MPALNWGLIGASDIAATRVIGAIRTSGGNAVGVFSGSADRARDFAASHGLASATTDLDELLAGDINAVYISSTNDKHFDQATRALKAGKHVLCESRSPSKRSRQQPWWNWRKKWASPWQPTTTSPAAPACQSPRTGGGRGHRNRPLGQGRPRRAPAGTAARLAAGAGTPGSGVILTSPATMRRSSTPCWDVPWQSPPWPSSRPCGTPAARRTPP